MGAKLRIATWNLDRSGIRKKTRVGPQLKKLEALDADILVLTETHESIRPSGYDFHIASERDPDYHQEGESCVSIWSRYPLTEIPSNSENRYLTVCAEVHGQAGIGEIVVYGTIITYGADGVAEGLAKHWERHRAAVKSQAEEWNTLSQRYPGHLRVIAGDFNENLDGKRWYGVKDAKDAIQSGLATAGMLCPTAAKSISLLSGDGILSRSTVDHICVSSANTKILRVLAWEGNDGGVTLSDHNGILIDIEHQVAKE